MRPSVLGTLSVLWETVFSQGKCLLLRTLPACLFVRGGHICTHDPVCLLRPCLSFSIYDAISLLDALSVLRSTVCPREPVCPQSPCLSSEPLSVLVPLSVFGAPACPWGPCLSSGPLSVLGGCVCPQDLRGFLSFGAPSFLGEPVCHWGPCLPSTTLSLLGILSVYDSWNNIPH